MGQLGELGYLEQLEKLEQLKQRGQLEQVEIVSSNRLGNLDSWSTCLNFIDKQRMDPPFLPCQYSLCRWRTVRKVFSQMGSQGLFLKKCPKTLQTKEKQGEMRPQDTTNIIKPT